FSQLPLLAFLLHNGTLLLGLNVVALGRKLYQRAYRAVPPVLSSAAATRMFWLGALWLLIPQLAALFLAYGTGQAVFLSRYLSYTSFGGAILIAWAVLQVPVRRWRMGITAGLTAAVCLFSFTQISSGVGLSLPGSIRTGVDRLGQLDDQGCFEPGDLVLIR